MKRAIRRWAYAACRDVAYAIYDIAAWITTKKEHR